MKSAMLKGISLFVAIAFFVTTIIWDPSGAIAQSFEFAEQSKIQRDLQQYLYSIPAQWGALSGQWMPPTTSTARTFIVHIQDAHANPEAQRNIKSMLSYLDKKYPGLVIGIEGLKGSLHPEYLDFFTEYPDANRAVIEDLHQKGELNGAELFLLEKYQKRQQTTDYGLKTKDVEVLAAVSSLQSPVSGIEDLGLYRDNLKTYRELLSKRDEVQTLLNPGRAQLEKEISLVLNADLRDFLKERSRRKEGRFDVSTQGDPQLQVYVRYLAQLSSKVLAIDLTDSLEQLRFPNLLRVLLAEQAQRDFDPETAKAQWMKTVQTIRSLVRDTNEKKFSDALSSFAREKGFLPEAESAPSRYSIDRAFYPRKLLEGLFRFAKKHGVKLETQADFLKSWKCIVFQAEIDVNELLQEMASLENGVIRKLARSEKEMVIVRHWEMMDLLEKLLRLELTREEYEKVVAQRSQMEIFTKGSGGLAAFLTKAFHFYKISIERDHAMVENLLSFMPEGKDQKPRVGVLYTGGFHSGGIHDLLRQKGIGYAVLTPRTHAVDHGELYSEVMSGEHADLSAYFKVKNPFATKQEALLFKELLETAAPVLFETYRRSTEEIAKHVSDTMAKHPVLSQAITAELSGPSAVIFHSKPGYRANIPGTAAVMPPAMTGDALYLRQLESQESVWGRSLSAEGFEVTVDFGEAKALTLNVKQTEIISATKSRTVKLDKSIEATMGSLADFQTQSTSAELSPGVFADAVSAVSGTPNTLARSEVRGERKVIDGKILSPIPMLGTILPLDPKGRSSFHWSIPPSAVPEAREKAEAFVEELITSYQGDFKVRKTERVSQKGLLAWIFPAIETKIFSEFLSKKLKVQKKKGIPEKTAIVEHPISQLLTAIEENEEALIYQIKEAYDVSDLIPPEERWNNSARASIAVSELIQLMSDLTQIMYFSENKLDPLPKVRELIVSLSQEKEKFHQEQMEMLDATVLYLAKRKEELVRRRIERKMLFALDQFIQSILSGPELLRDFKPRIEAAIEETAKALDEIMARKLEKISIVIQQKQTEFPEGPDMPDVRKLKEQKALIQDRRDAVLAKKASLLDQLRSSADFQTFQKGVETDLKALEGEIKEAQNYIKEHGSAADQSYLEGNKAGLHQGYAALFRSFEFVANDLEGDFDAHSLTGNGLAEGWDQGRLDAIRARLGNGEAVTKQEWVEAINQILSIRMRLEDYQSMRDNPDILTMLERRDSDAKNLLLKASDPNFFLSKLQLERLNRRLLEAIYPEQLNKAPLFRSLLEKAEDHPERPLLWLFYDDQIFGMLKTRLLMGPYRGHQSFDNATDSGMTGQALVHEVMKQLQETPEEEVVQDGSEVSYILVVPPGTTDEKVTPQIERYGRQIKGIVGIDAMPYTHWVALIRGRSHKIPVLLVLSNNAGDLLKQQGTRAILMPQSEENGALILNPNNDDLAEEKKKALELQRLRAAQIRMRQLIAPVRLAVNIDASNAGALTQANKQGGSVVSAGLVRTDVIQSAVAEKMKHLATNTATSKFDPEAWLDGFGRSEVRMSFSLMERFSKWDPKGRGNPDAIHAILAVRSGTYEEVLKQQAFVGEDVPLRTLDLQRDSKNRSVLEMLEKIAEEHPLSTVRKDPSKPISGFNFYENSSIGELMLALEMAAMIIAYQKICQTVPKGQRGRLVPLFPLIETHAQFEWIKQKIWPLAQRIALWEIANRSGFDAVKIERAEKDIQKIGSETKFGIMVEYMSLLTGPELELFLRDPDIVRFNVGNNDLVKNYWERKGLRVNRENPASGFLLERLAPDLITGLEELIRRAQKVGKKVCFCGGMAESGKFLLAVEWWRRQIGTPDMAAKDSPISVSGTGDGVSQVNYALQVFRGIPGEELETVFGSSQQGSELDMRAKELSSRYLSISEAISVLVEEWQERYERAGFQYGLYRLNIHPENDLGGSKEFVSLKKVVRAWLANNEPDLLKLQLSEKDTAEKEEVRRILTYLADHKMMIRANIERILEAFDFIESVREVHQELQTQDPEKFSGNLYPAIMGEFVNAWEKTWRKKYHRSESERPKWLSEGKTNGDKSPEGDKKEEQRINDFYKHYHTQATIIFKANRRTLHEIDASLIRPTYSHEEPIEEFKGYDGLMHKIKIQTRHGLTFSLQRGRKGEEAGQYVHVENALENFRARPELMLKVFAIAAERGAYISHRTQWAMEELQRELESDLESQTTQGSAKGRQEGLKLAFNTFFGKLLRLNDPNSNIAYVLWRMEEYYFLAQHVPYFRELNRYSLKDGTIFPLQMQTLQTMETLEGLYRQQDDFVNHRAARVFRQLRADPGLLQLARLAVLLHPMIENETGSYFTEENVSRITKQFLEGLGIHDMTLERRLVWLMFHQHGFARYGLLSLQDIEKKVNEIVKSEGAELHLFSVLYAVTFAKQATEANPESRIMLPRQGADNPLASLDKFFLAGQALLAHAAKVPVSTAALTAHDAVTVANYEVTKGRKAEVFSQLQSLVISQDWKSILDDYLANTLGGKYPALRQLLIQTLTSPDLFQKLFERFSARTSTYYMQTMDTGSLLKQLLFYRHLLYLRENKDHYARATVFFPLPHQYNEAYEVIIGAGFDEVGEAALDTRVLYENGFFVENAAIRNPPDEPVLIRFVGHFPHGENMALIQKKIVSDLSAVFAPITSGKKFWRISLRVPTDTEMRFERADEVYEDQAIYVPKTDAWVGSPTRAIFDAKPVDYYGRRVSVLHVSIGSSNWRGQLLVLLTTLSWLQELDINGLQFEQIKGFPPETQVFVTKKGEPLAPDQQALIARRVAEILDMKPITIQSKEAFPAKPVERAETVTQTLKINPLARLHFRPAAQIIKLLNDYRVHRATLRFGDHPDIDLKSLNKVVAAGIKGDPQQEVQVTIVLEGKNRRKLEEVMEKIAENVIAIHGEEEEQVKLFQPVQRSELRSQPFGFIGQLAGQVLKKQFRFPDLGFHKARSEVREEVTRQAKITNKKGIHERPAGQIVKVGENYPRLEIFFENEGIKEWGKGVMALLMLAAKKGSQVTITASGSRHDIEAYFQELAGLVDESEPGREKIFLFPKRAELRLPSSGFMAGLMGTVSETATFQRSEIRGQFVKEYQIGNELGIHARPAAQIAKLIREPKYASLQIEIEDLDSGMEPVISSSATLQMDIQMLAAKKGHKIKFTVEGSKALADAFFYKLKSLKDDDSHEDIFKEISQGPALSSGRSEMREEGAAPASFLQRPIKKILLADDSLFVRVVLGKILDGTGAKFELLAVQDGQEALDQIERFNPDAILTDVHMPKLSGPEWVMQAVQKPQFSNIPVVFMSDLTEMPDALHIAMNVLAEQHPVHFLHKKDAGNRTILLDLFQNPNAQNFNRWPGRSEMRGFEKYPVFMGGFLDPDYHAKTKGNVLLFLKSSLTRTGLTVVADSVDEKLPPAVAILRLSSPSTKNNIRKLKALNPNVKIILITGGTAFFTEEQLHTMGADKLLYMPFASNTELADVVHEYIRSAQAIPEAQTPVSVRQMDPASIFQPITEKDEVLIEQLFGKLEAWQFDDLRRRLLRDTQTGNIYLVKYESELNPLEAKRFMWSTKDDLERQLLMTELFRRLDGNAVDTLVPDDAERWRIAQYLDLSPQQASTLHLVSLASNYKLSDKAVKQNDFNRAMTRHLVLAVLTRWYDYHTGNHGPLADARIPMTFDHEQAFHPSLAGIDDFTRRFIPNYFGNISLEQMLSMLDLNELTRSVEAVRSFDLQTFKTDFERKYAGGFSRERFYESYFKSLVHWQHSFDTDIKRFFEILFSSQLKSFMPSQITRPLPTLEQIQVALVPAPRSELRSLKPKQEPKQKPKLIVLVGTVSLIGAGILLSLAWDRLFNPQYLRVREFQRQALQNQPPILTEMAEGIGFRHQTLRNWEGMDQVEVFYGGHAHPALSQGIVDVSKKVLHEKGQWVLALEDAQALLDSGMPIVAADNIALLALREESQAPLIDPWKGLDHLSEPVIRGVAAKLGKNYEETRDAVFFEKWLEQVRIALLTNPNAVVHEIFLEAINDLAFLGEHDPEQTKLVFKRIIKELEDPAHAQSFLELVNKIAPTSNQVRMELGGQRLKAQLQQMPEKKLLILMGPSYGPIFGLPSLENPSYQPFSPQELSNGFLLLNKIGLPEYKSPPRAEVRAMGAVEVTMTDRGISVKLGEAKGQSWEGNQFFMLAQFLKKQGIKPADFRSEKTEGQRGTVPVLTIGKTKIPQPDAKSETTRAAIELAILDLMTQPDEKKWDVIPLVSSPEEAFAQSLNSLQLPPYESWVIELQQAVEAGLQIHTVQTVGGREETKYTYGPLGMYLRSRLKDPPAKFLAVVQQMTSNSQSQPFKLLFQLAQSHFLADRDGKLPLLIPMGRKESSQEVLGMENPARQKVWMDGREVAQFLKPMLQENQPVRVYIAREVTPKGVSEDHDGKIWKQEGRIFYQNGVFKGELQPTDLVLMDAEGMLHFIPFPSPHLVTHQGNPAVTSTATEAFISHIQFAQATYPRVFLQARSEVRNRILSPFYRKMLQGGKGASESLSYMMEFQNRADTILNALDQPVLPHYLQGLPDIDDIVDRAKNVLEKITGEMQANVSLGSQMQSNNMLTLYKLGQDFLESLGDLRRIAQGTSFDNEFGISELITLFSKAAGLDNDANQPAVIGDENYRVLKNIFQKTAQARAEVRGATKLDGIKLTGQLTSNVFQEIAYRLRANPEPFLALDLPLIKSTNKKPSSQSTQKRIEVYFPGIPATPMQMVEIKSVSKVRSEVREDVREYLERQFQRIQRTSYFAPNAEAFYSKEKVSGREVHTLSVQHLSQRALEILYRDVLPEVLKNPEEWLFVVESESQEERELFRKATGIPYEIPEESFALEIAKTFKIPVATPSPILPLLSLEVTQEFERKGMNAGKPFQFAALDLRYEALARGKEFSWSAVKSGLITEYARQWKVDPKVLDKAYEELRQIAWKIPSELANIYKEMSRLLTETANGLMRSKMRSVLEQHDQKTKVFILTGSLHAKEATDEVKAYMAEHPRSEVRDASAAALTVPVPPKQSVIVEGDEATKLLNALVMIADDQTIFDIGVLPTTVWEYDPPNASFEFSDRSRDAASAYITIRKTDYLIVDSKGRVIYVPVIDPDLSKHPALEYKKQFVVATADALLGKPSSDFTTNLPSPGQTQEGNWTVLSLQELIDQYGEKIQRQEKTSHATESDPAVMAALQNLSEEMGGRTLGGLSIMGAEEIQGLTMFASNWAQKRQLILDKLETFPDLELRKIFDSLDLSVSKEMSALLAKFRNYDDLGKEIRSSVGKGNSVDFYRRKQAEFRDLKNRKQAFAMSIDDRLIDWNGKLAELEEGTGIRSEVREGAIGEPFESDHGMPLQSLKAVFDQLTLFDSLDKNLAQKLIEKGSQSRFTFYLNNGSRKEGLAQASNPTSVTITNGDVIPWDDIEAAEAFLTVQDSKELWRGTFLLSNESFLARDKFAVSGLGRPEKTVHIGLAGMFNFDMLAARKTGYAILLDKNERQIEAFRLMRNVIGAAINSTEFVRSFLDALQKRYDYFFPNHEEFEKFSESFKFGLTQSDSWLGNAEDFDWIRNMFREGRILSYRADVANANLFRAIGDWMGRQQLELDSVYLSNVPEWLLENRGGGIVRKNVAGFYQGLLPLLLPQTLIIEAYENPFPSDELLPRRRFNQKEWTRDFEGRVTRKLQAPIESLAAAFPIATPGFRSEVRGDGRESSETYIANRNLSRLVSRLESWLEDFVEGQAVDLDRMALFRAEIDRLEKEMGYPPQNSRRANLGRAIINFLEACHLPSPNLKLASQYRDQVGRIESSLNQAQHGPWKKSAQEVLNNMNLYLNRAEVRTKPERNYESFALALLNDHDIGTQPFTMRQLQAKGLRFPYDYIYNAIILYGYLEKGPVAGGAQTYRLTAKGREAAKQEQTQLKPWETPYLFSIQPRWIPARGKDYEPSVTERLQKAWPSLKQLPPALRTDKYIGQLIGVRANYPVKLKLQEMGLEFPEAGRSEVRAGKGRDPGRKISLNVKAPQWGDIGFSDLASLERFLDAHAAQFTSDERIVTIELSGLKEGKKSTLRQIAASFEKPKTRARAGQIAEKLPEKILYLKARDAHLAGVQKITPSLEVILQEIRFAQGRPGVATRIETRLKNIFPKDKSANFTITTMYELLQQDVEILQEHRRMGDEVIGALNEALNFFDLRLTGTKPFDGEGYLKAREEHVAGTKKIVPDLNMILLEIRYGQNQPVRAARLETILKNYDITALEQLLEKSESTLFKYPHLGTAVIDALKEALAFYGLQLARSEIRADRKPTPDGVRMHGQMVLEPTVVDLSKLTKWPRGTLLNRVIVAADNSKTLAAKATLPISGDILNQLQAFLHHSGNDLIVNSGDSTEQLAISQQPLLDLLSGVANRYRLIAQGGQIQFTYHSDGFVKERKQIPDWDIVKRERYAELMLRSFYASLERVAKDKTGPLASLLREVNPEEVRTWGTQRMLDFKKIKDKGTWGKLASGETNYVFELLSPRLQRELGRLYLYDAGGILTLEFDDCKVNNVSQFSEEIADEIRTKFSSSDDAYLFAGPTFVDVSVTTKAHAVEENLESLLADKEDYTLVVLMGDGSNDIPTFQLADRIRAKHPKAYVLIFFLNRIYDPSLPDGTFVTEEAQLAGALPVLRYLNGISGRRIEDIGEMSGVSKWHATAPSEIRADRKPTPESVRSELRDLNFGTVATPAALSLLKAFKFNVPADFVREEKKPWIIAAARALSGIFSAKAVAAEAEGGVTDENIIKARLWIALQLKEIIEQNAKDLGISDERLKGILANIDRMALDKTADLSSMAQGPVVHANLPEMTDAQWQEFLKQLPVVLGVVVSLHANLFFNMPGDTVLIKEREAELLKKAGESGLGFAPDQVRIFAITGKNFFESLKLSKGDVNAVFAFEESQLPGHQKNIKTRWLADENAAGHMPTLAADIATILYAALDQKIVDPYGKPRRPSEYNSGVLLAAVMNAIQGYLQIRTAA